MRRALLAFSAAVVLSVGFPTIHASAAPTTIPGIDVSEYQGTIDWARVANSDVRFIFIRATKGPRYVDAQYALNSAGATSANIKWTAYHSAVPKHARRDPIIQANHFVETAQLTAGNILPVLDIERTGGLGRSRLQDWVAKWLNRVSHLTGNKPMIYTSPYFWRAALGDTTRFSSRGYKLWIANWGVHSPDVPARNWSGNGWTFWQWTDHGSVAGIAGPVDKDRYRGTHIGRLVTMH